MAGKQQTIEERWKDDGPIGIVGGQVIEASEDYDDEEGLSVADAAPRTLYVRRDLLNAKAVRKHFADQLGESADLLMDASKWHVTVAYSKTPVDWAKLPDDWFGGGDEDGNLRVKPGGMRMMERLGAEDPRAAVVVQFSSTALSMRWRDFCEAGASWDFEDYQPHVTIAWDVDQKIDVSALKPWTGELLFGPEIFEEVDEDWKAKAGIEEGDEPDEDEERGDA